MTFCLAFNDWLDYESLIAPRTGQQHLTDTNEPTARKTF